MDKLQILAGAALVVSGAKHFTRRKKSDASKVLAGVAVLFGAMLVSEGLHADAIANGTDPNASFQP